MELELVIWIWNWVIGKENWVVEFQVRRERERRVEMVETEGGRNKVSEFV